MSKKIPFDLELIDNLKQHYPTPFYIYDETGIRDAAIKLNEAFNWNNGFKNFFAVKATPNPRIIKIFREEGMGMDCANDTELMLAEMMGVNGEEIILSSNNTSEEDFKKAMELGVIVNLDDITHLEFLEKTTGLPELLSFRHNPGNQLGAGNEIIGYPEEAKYGMPKEHILKAIGLAKQKGVKRFGLHIMGISNSLDSDIAIKISELMFRLAMDIKNKYQVELEFINLGGGIGIPYSPEDEEFDLEHFANGVKANYEQILNYKPRMFMECGRYLTGPHGYLVSTVQHIKKTYKTYVGLDASMQNLMRPGMYGAYHQISVLGKEGMPLSETYDVTGSLCENNDKFAINRKLPEVDAGDVLVIHDAGAHAHAMGFNYNGKLRSGELLLHPDKTTELIRRAETPEDYFATLNI